MKIDITSLLTNRTSSIPLEGDAVIPEEFLVDSRIDNLKDVKVRGKITLNEDNELVVEANIKGTMTLKDDLTLEPVDYSFDTDIEENIPESQNLLDITDILWQNILVEMPSKVRSTSEDIEIHGDGWRVISEETFERERNTANNPFQDLNELLKTKEDK